jgi:hypothetical protein
LQESSEDQRADIPVIRIYGNGLFFVHSTNSGKDYLVDLSDPEWPDGQCDCAHFRYVLYPLIVRGLPPANKACKHIEAVIESGLWKKT